ncbi:MAG: hypothetical protein JNM62_02480 [Flavobacteriales bacterium]|nr:hypothetical protein [Flavobacteriales bacterium]
MPSVRDDPGEASAGALVSEVDSLYFLRAKNGRLMLRNELRIGVKFDEQLAEA